MLPAFPPQLLDAWQDLFGGSIGTAARRVLSTREIYQGCEMGRSLFYSMHMNETFSMDEFLNASKYLEGIGEPLQSLSVDVSGVTLLPETARFTVERFKDFSQLDRINYHQFQTLLNREVVKTDLRDFADTLEKIAYLPGNAAIQKDLMMEVVTARQLAVAVQRQNSSRMRMSSSLEALASISREYQMNAAKTLLSAGEVETALRLRLPGVVQNIPDEVLECRWLPVSVSNMYTAACENLIGPWNAFWLCLGWCCAFLVPGVIFSILAAGLWQPKSPAVSEGLFKMPGDTPDRAKPISYLTMDDMPGKRKDMKEVTANMYITLDEVLSSNEAREWRREK